MPDAHDESVGSSAAAAEVPTSPQPGSTTSEARADESRFRLYTFAVLTVGLLAVAAVSAWLPFEGSIHLWWIGPLLAIAFLGAEQLGVNVDVRSGIS